MHMHNPFRQLPIYLVKAYQYLLRPWLGKQCRFYPTCSDYALQTLQQTCKPLYKVYGQIIWRLLRCQPYSKGGFDYPNCQAAYFKINSKTNVCQCKNQ